jgi:hypothetical protein
MGELAREVSLFNLDMLTHFVKNAGFDLRKEEPARLKAFIESVEKQKALAQDFEEPVKLRLNFLLEDLDNVRNNKKPGAYDAYHAKIKPLITWLKSNVHTRSEIATGPLTLEWKQLTESLDHPDWWEKQEGEEMALQRDKVREMGVGSEIDEE